MSDFPNYRQTDTMDCGPTCLRMVAKFYGRNYSLQYLRERSFITREGVSMLGISDAAGSIGFRTIGMKMDYEKLKNETPLPCIIHWKQNHFVVVYKIKTKSFFNKKTEDIIYISDPARGLLQFTKEEFVKCWISTIIDDNKNGVALLLEPTPKFYELSGEKTDRTKLSFLFNYLRPYKKYIVQLFIGMLLGSLLQLVFPLLTQSIVDVGINNNNLHFITLILIAQLLLFAGRMSVDFLRSWILLHISSRIDINLISDFLIKLMKLPISFFDSKMIGDIMQRIGDHSRIQTFLTGSSLSTIFSLINLIVFGVVLAYYDLRIIGIFIFGNTCYMLWILLFLNRRRKLDAKRFAVASGTQSNLFQLITGMQEIKLNNCENQKRWKWERLQASMFKISIKGLVLGQYQQLGSFFLSQTTGIVITFFAAKSVISGEITLGMMMAITYIVGQVSAPVDQLIGFVQALQDAKISLERLGEIHNRNDEEPESNERLSVLPDNQAIKLKNVTFSYNGPNSPVVLEDINLEIPEGKITAIVGTSGSGKTTLVKLLLGFYQLGGGEIRIGDTLLQNINGAFWRSKCGVVMQDGFIFSETIAENIAPGDEDIDRKMLVEAAEVSNIKDFIESLPLSFNTKIGIEGNGLSQGQKQRILIARAVYKKPDFIFFDEATNALDANNEKVIMQNLENFFKGKTVVVVAHRLSTVKNANQIVVLEKGKIVEIGTHIELTSKQGKYYELVKNQLELGN